MTDHDRLRRMFESFGCRTEAPGFCNAPAFLEAERHDSELLERYADFILSMPLDAAYLATAEEAIRRTADFLHQRLVRSTRLGACIDASCILSEFLNKQGVWSFVVKGAASVLFPAARSVAAARMQPIMHSGNPATAGHAWVCVPPFKIVDLTIGLQPYSSRARRLVPRDYVLAREGKPSTPEVADLVEDDALPAIARHLGYRPELEDIYERISPGLAERVAKYGCTEVTLTDGVLVRYTACAVGGMAEALDQWRNLKLDGRWPGELFESYAKTVGL